jgi:nucleoid-associated protein YgaU
VTATVAPTKVQAKPKQKPQEKKKEIAPKGKVYIVTADDTLWNIAEKVYKSGYNWVDIARANKLNNPGIIHKGDKLILPKVEQKIATVTTTPTKSPTVTPTKEKVSTQTDKITGTSYTVVKNDTVWNIAVRAYGDGYKWTDIAQANNLQNPSLIHSGNKLKIPRK